VVVDDPDPGVLAAAYDEISPEPPDPEVRP
jgi:hypothetical protein